MLQVVSDRLFRRFARTLGHPEWIEELAAARIPSGPVLSPAEVLAHPHVAGSPILTTTTYPGVDGPFPIVTAPVRLAGHVTTTRPAPLGGQDTYAILAELGYAPDEIAHLHADRVV